MKSIPKPKGMQNHTNPIDHLFTCSAVGLASGSFWRQASTNEQNSGEKFCLDGDGDESSKIFNEESITLGGPNQNDAWRRKISR